MKRLIAFALLLNAALLGVIAWQLVTDNHNTDRQASAADKDEILKHMSIVELPIDDKGGKAKTIRFSGVNVQVVNGSGQTAINYRPVYNGNGLGNLIVGYQEKRLSGNDRRGIHNIVVGEKHNYLHWGGQVVGFFNTISGKYSSVCGGFENTASGLYSTVSGGRGNTAEKQGSTVSGGQDNKASGHLSVVSGGRGNTAEKQGSTVSGGESNKASGVNSVVSGGAKNNASKEMTTVSGGFENTSSGSGSAVSGGSNNTSAGQLSTVSGGLGQKADKVRQHLP